MSTVDKNRKRILKNGDSYIGLLGRVNDYANDVVDLKKMMMIKKMIERKDKIIKTNTMDEGQYDHETAN